jgi:hypothetical protein
MNENIKIAVLIPSRGLVFAEVIDSLHKNLEKYNHTIRSTWNLVIPDSFNFLVNEALADKDVTHILTCEEDTVIPDKGLDALIVLNSDIACIDYGVQGWGCVTRDSKTNEVLWCGLGCTLIKRKVFEAMEAPYFRSDKVLLLNYWPELRWIDAGKQAYGGQDIYFCVTAARLGFKINQVVSAECKHLKLEELGRPEINKGLHKIGVKDTISKRQTI